MFTSKKVLNRLFKLKTKLKNRKLDIAFLKKCENNNVFPLFIKVKINGTSKSAKKAKSEAEKIWLKMKLK
jgi:hypothetical protein